MAGARINLVRVDNLETTEGLDVESGSTLYDQADEVELVTPDGEVAVMPSAPTWINQDIKYQYTNGGLGISPKRRRHQIALNVDYLGDETRGRLEQWVHDRALVYFNPGFGRYTDLAYRPLEGDGTTYADRSTTLYDLTGRWALSSLGDETHNYAWDSWLRVMREFGAHTNQRRVTPTPGGAGQVCEYSSVNKVNLHRPGYPLSALEGSDDGTLTEDSGWTRADTTGEITFSYVADGFGHDNMPGALRVVTEYATSSFRSINCNGQWDDGDDEWNGLAEWTGEGLATMSIWVKGRFSSNAGMTFEQDGGDSSSLIFNEDCSEWRKYSLSVYSSDWTTGLPELSLHMHAGTDGDSDDFLVGPCVVHYVTGANSNTAPEWAPFNTAVTGSRMQVASYTYPVTGSMSCSFWWPTDTDVDMYGSGLIAHSSAAGKMRISSSGTTLTWSRTSGSVLSGTITPAPGQVCTAIAVWGNDGDMRLFFNGELIDTAGSAERESDIGAASGTLYLGYSDGYGSHPFLPLAFRIDRRAWTTTEIAQLDMSLRDPVCNLLSVQARGRKYRIVQLPSTPRNQQGGTAWTGQLVLEEYEYDSNLADITTAETY